MCDGGRIHRTSAVSGGVRIIGDIQCREVLPSETGSVVGTATDIGRQHGPRPRLRDPRFEEHRHGE